MGSTLSLAMHIDDEVTARIIKASVAFGRLGVNIWDRNGIKLDIKLSLQGCGTVNPLAYIWDIDSTLTSCKET